MCISPYLAYILSIFATLVAKVSPPCLKLWDKFAKTSKINEKDIKNAVHEAYFLHRRRFVPLSFCYFFLLNCAARVIRHGSYFSISG